MSFTQKKDEARPVRERSNNKKTNNGNLMDNIDNNVLDIESLTGGGNYFANRSVANIHEFYLSGSVGPASDYTNWFDIIRRAQRGDTIKIYINSYGGDLFTAIQLIRALNDCQGTVITSVEGACMSAATLIFLNADNFEVSQHSMFMFHNYSSGCFGKGGEMFDQIVHEKEWSEKIMRTEYEDFLTSKEIDSILANKDLWMDGEEVSNRLNKRAEKWDKADRKAIKKANKEAKRASIAQDMLYEGD